MNRLICGDVFEVLPTLGKFKCLIADPPDNIGLKYNNFSDSLTDVKYGRFLRDCWRLFIEHADIIWISYNARHTFLMGAIVEEIKPEYPDYEFKPFVQTFTFGQNNKYDCGNGHRPIVRARHKDALIYPQAIKVPSWRQLNGDKRAAPGGRVPLDVWDDFPRITGNCKERRRYHPTQLREGLVKRMVDFSTLPGESVADVFSGTGTVLRAVNDREITSIEVDPFYCQMIADEHGLTMKKAA